MWINSDATGVDRGFFHYPSPDIHGVGPGAYGTDSALRLEGRQGGKALREGLLQPPASLVLEIVEVNQVDPVHAQPFQAPV